MKKHDSGFAIFELAAVFVVMVIIGITGWFIYQKSQPADETTPSSQSTSETPKITGQNLQTLENKTFSVTFVNEWIVAEEQTYENACGENKTANTVALKKGDKTITIGSNSCGRGYSTDAGIEYIVNDMKISVKNKDLVPCSVGDAFCSAGDGVLNVVSGARSESGNLYVIKFSNSTNEDLSQTALADIYEVIEAIALR